MEGSLKALRLTVVRTAKGNWLIRTQSSERLDAGHTHRILTVPPTWLTLPLHGPFPFLVHQKPNQWGY